MTRMKYGFERTISATEKDVDYCRRSPGILSPGEEQDLYLATREGGESLLAWAEAHLETASGNWKDRRLWYLRPAGTPCHWLDKHDRCSVHAVSPYGCAFFGSGDPPSYSPQEESARIDAQMRDLAQYWDGFRAAGRTPQNCGDGDYGAVYWHLVGVKLGKIKSAATPLPPSAPNS